MTAIHRESGSLKCPRHSGPSAAATRRTFQRASEFQPPKFNLNHHRHVCLHSAYWVILSSLRPLIRHAFVVSLPETTLGMKYCAVCVQPVRIVALSAFAYDVVSCGFGSNFVFVEYCTRRDYGSDGGHHAHCDP
jgi:hypothetical protein